MYGFDYQKPTDLAAAKAALAAEGAQALSGGQTLIPVLKQRLAMPSALIDLTGIEAMKGIRRVGDHLVIGAATPHAVVAASADVQNAIPGIASLASQIGDLRFWAAVRLWRRIGARLQRMISSAVFMRRC